MIVKNFTIREWLIVALLLTITVLFARDVFYNKPKPEALLGYVHDPGHWTASAYEIEVPVSICNDTEFKRIYVYVWSNRNLAGRIIDEKSELGKVYSLRIRLGREDVVVCDQSFGLRFPKVLQSGQLAIGVAFEDPSDKSSARRREFRYDLLISRDNIRLETKGRGWESLEGMWRQTQAESALSISDPRSYETILSETPRIDVSFRSPVKIQGIRAKVEESVQNAGFSLLDLIPIHDEGGSNTDYVNLNACHFEITCAVASSVGNVHSNEQLPRLESSLRHCLGYMLQDLNLPVKGRIDTE